MTAAGPEWMRVVGEIAVHNRIKEAITFKHLMAERLASSSRIVEVERSRLTHTCTVKIFH